MDENLNELFRDADLRALKNMNTNFLGITETQKQFIEMPQLILYTYS